MPQASCGTPAPGDDSPSSAGLADNRTVVIERFRQAVHDKADLATALLVAIGAWSAPTEVVDGIELTYLLDGEAFDWLQLAERLSRALPEGSIEKKQVEGLVFSGELPASVSEADFKAALGPEKYRAHLNFFYGVVVEEALWLAVEQEVEKERGVRGLRHPAGVQDTVAERLYSADISTLVRQFQLTQGRGRSIKFTLAGWKAFTYWLFKRRLSTSDQARSASDTRKGLQMLGRIRAREKAEP